MRGCKQRLWPENYEESCKIASSHLFLIHLSYVEGQFVNTTFERGCELHAVFDDNKQAFWN